MQELIVEYSDCRQKAPLYPAQPERILGHFESTFKSTKQINHPTWQRKVNGNTTVCSLWFDIPNDIGPPVYMYYRLTNFYQNHRRYVQSLDLPQLKGQAVDNQTIKGSPCDPLTVDKNGKAYYPCGLIANSLFNDTIHSPVQVNKEAYNMTNKGIAWDSEKQLIQNTQYKWYEVSPPPNWHKRYPNGYTAENFPNLHEQEDFMVWMRTAALPDFSKLSRRNDTTVMKAGTYSLDIEDRMVGFFPP